MIFGPLGGTIVVVSSLSVSSALCCTMGRLLARRQGWSLQGIFFLHRDNPFLPDVAHPFSPHVRIGFFLGISPKAAAVDSALATRQPRTTFLLALLLRLSPVVPFTFSNYLSGITSIPASVLAVATLLGTLPSQAAYVAAGALGHQALTGELQLPPQIALAGAVATVGAVALVGRVAQQTLERMDLDKLGEVQKGKA